MTLTQHPLSAAFPEMDEADYLALRDDIDDNGQREPIITLDGMVLDGWHRYRACMDIGIEPTQFKYGGDDPVAFVRSQNLHRRHLTASQRTAAIMACLEWKPPGRPNKSAPGAYLSTQPEIAKAAGVAVRTVQQVQAAQKVGLLEPIRDGALTAKEAAQIARGTPSKPKPKAPPPPTIVEDHSDQLAESAHVVAELSEQVDVLTAKLAVENMDTTESEKTEAANIIADLRAQVKTLNAELDAMRVSRDRYQGENAQMMKQIAMLRRQIDKQAA